MNASSAASLPAVVSQHRVALVIGNQAYRQIKALENPVNDARLMAATLRSLGFDVIERFDQTKEQDDDRLRFRPDHHAAARRL